jgi:hypothetical protein
MWVVLAALPSRFTLQILTLTPLKYAVYRNNLCTVREQKQYIFAAVIFVLGETLAAFVQNFHCLVQMVMDSDAAYIKNAFM